MFPVGVRMRIVCSESRCKGCFWPGCMSFEHKGTYEQNSIADVYSSGISIPGSSAYVANGALLTSSNGGLRMLQFNVVYGNKECLFKFY